MQINLGEGNGCEAEDRHTLEERDHLKREQQRGWEYICYYITEMKHQQKISAIREVVEKVVWEVTQESDE